jgi:hypothetical protein
MLTEFFCELSAYDCKDQLTTVLMSVGIFCFLGFIYALNTLNSSIGVTQICWWLLEVFFGLDATGFEKACE